MLLCAVSAMFGQAYDGVFGPVNLTDKIVPAGNGYAMTTNVVNNTALELLKIKGNSVLSFRKTYPTGLVQLQPNYRGITDAMSGFVLANIGRNVSVTPNRIELVVIRVLQEGTQNWLRRFTLPALWEVGDVFWTADNHILVVGATNLGQMFAIKITPTGTLVWQKTYEEGGKAWAVENYPGGGYLVAGTKRVWRIWWDGTVRWTQPVSIPDDPAGGVYNGTRERIVLLQNSGFVILGTAKNAQYSAIYHAKYTWNAGQEFSKLFDQTSIAAPGAPIVEVSNGVQTGFTTMIFFYKKGNSQAGNLSGTLLGYRTDLNGNIQNSGTVGNPTQVLHGDFIRYNGKYAFGSTGITPSLQYNVFLQSSLPWAVPPLLVAPDPAARAAYPNPATDGLTVPGEFPFGGKISLIATDGRTVMSQPIEPGESQIRLDVSQLPRGLWLLEVENDGERTTEKVVLR